MDEDRPSISPPDLHVRFGFDVAPTMRGVRRSVDLDNKPVVPTRDQVERLSANPHRESSFVVYCGNEQQVSEGFAIALRAMGVEANILQADVELLAICTNREDS
jgi:hypothetical protein